MAFSRAPSAQRTHTVQRAFALDCIDSPHDDDELKFDASPPPQPRRYAVGSFATSPKLANIELLVGKCISFHMFPPQSLSVAVDFECTP
jgi:hypothetical protein